MNFDQSDKILQFVLVCHLFN